jgi:hypothetical protein
MWYGAVGRGKRWVDWQRQAVFFQINMFPELGCNSVVECLPSMCKALRSILHKYINIYISICTYVHIYTFIYTVFKSIHYLNLHSEYSAHLTRSENKEYRIMTNASLKVRNFIMYLC